MSSALDDEDLALSINPNSYTRRGSARASSSLNSEQAALRPAPPPPQDPNAQRHHGQGHRSQGTIQQRLGQYKILNTIGEGSFGKVKLAVHQVTNQKVALKIISRKKLVARDMAGRIEREIQYLQLLRHPHIIKLYTVITTPLEIIMVLEYAGSELFQYIVDHGKMQEDKARQFFQQIVCAVEYCHRHKIVHRDLKPENLLLDDQLHVKIADFGLSNIMTDGNFLKTSCGSPNYAAPEVISGKLYAGPEVDVWSCGVILYVLLVGRLPFDDEYIPALFRKIASGQYHQPQHVSQGALRLIRKMLQVSPVHRITIQEIRQDAWFTKDLPSYLQPPAEEFFDTGIDPGKAIDPSSLAPKQTAQVQEKIHDSVVGKLGKTMGYGREDVHQALAVDEPNAIKDAYLIVRENQIMKHTPALADNPSFQPFLAQSPPTYTAASPIASFGERSDQAESLHKFNTPGQPNERSRQGSGHAAPIDQSRSPINTIGVLPSSLPDYHQAYMKGQPKPATGESPQEYAPTSASASSSTAQHDKQSPEAQAATARRLKPHSRSQANLERMNKPEAMTPLSNSAPTKKPRQTKWQFGIRSRNPPPEAMLAIYKALKAMGAEWQVPRIRRPHGRERRERTEEQDSDDSISGSEADDRSDPPSDDDRGYPSDEAPDSDAYHHQKHDSSSTASSGASLSRGRRSSRRDRTRYSAHNDWGYDVPSDPWIIKARFRKDGMYPPGVRLPHSAHSSRADLSSEAAMKMSELHPDSRRSSAQASPPTPSVPVAPSSGTASSLENPSLTGPAPGPPPSHITSHASNPASASSSASSRPQSRKTSLTHLLGSQAGSTTSAVSTGTNAGIDADESAFVYMTIQLYTIEKEFYLVDFKCAGYERLALKVSDSGSDVRRTESADDGGEGQHVREFDGQKEHDDGREKEGDAGKEREKVGMGRAADEKDVSSPFPFLDVASRLIIQLAEAG
ncbi:MAG: hypothetical protein Q9159_002694 [Coniocarpon cinnabarinum]